jgi:hypothetical protein
MSLVSSTRANGDVSADPAVHRISRMSSYSFDIQLFEEHTISPRERQSSNARYQCQHSNHSRNSETHVETDVKCR